VKLLFNQRERELAQFAGTDFEHRLALLIKTGRKQQIGGIESQHDIVRELHHGQSDVEFLPGGDLSLPAQRVIRRDVDRLSEPPVAKLPQSPRVSRGNGVLRSLSEGAFFPSGHSSSCGASYTSHPVPATPPYTASALDIPVRHCYHTPASRLG
jgi:hypothetical protein